MTKRFKTLGEKRRAIARNLRELRLLYGKNKSASVLAGAKAGIGGAPSTKKGDGDGR